MTNKLDNIKPYIDLPFRVGRSTLQKDQSREMWLELYKGAKIKVAASHRLNKWVSVPVDWLGLKINQGRMSVRQHRNNHRKTPKRHLNKLFSQGLILFRKLNLRLKHPITLREALIIALIVYIFWPNHGQAIGEVPPPPAFMPKISMLKPLQVPELPTQSQIGIIYTPQPTPLVEPVNSCGDNSYAHAIYMAESGCSTTITNALGCLGIGQSCPASKLLAVCPNEDYVCENQFFTNYANQVYGGWAGAYNFWFTQGHHWW